MTDDTPIPATVNIPEYIANQALVDPMDWETDLMYSDWRDFIGSRTQAIWSLIPTDVKLALAADAEDRT